MIEDKKVAKEINNLMLEYQAKLAESVSIVRDNCSEKDIYEYRIAIGNVLGLIIKKVMVPIYETHPDLDPDKKN